MPINRKKDTKGYYYQWGNHGKKYYYTANNPRSRDMAKSKAVKQAQAVYSSGYKEK